MKRPRNLMRLVAAIGAIVCMGLVVNACGSSSSSSSSASSGSTSAGSTSSGSTSASTKPVNMAGTLITTKNDGSFGQSIYTGMTNALKQYPNLKLTSVLENQTTNEVISNGIKQLAPLNQLVVTSGGSVAPSLDALAASFPSTHFLQISGLTTQKHDNVTGVVTNWGAGAYVVGAMAATMTKSKVIGFIGGQAVPDQETAIAGFKAGAKSVNPNVKVLVTETGSFVDVNAGKAAAAAQLDSGADVIYPFLDTAANGVYQAANQSGKNPAIFKITIPNCGAYSNMVGTQIVDLTLATQRLIDAYMTGKLTGGAIVLGLANPEVQRVVLCPKYANNSQLTNVLHQTVSDLNSGKVKLPANAVISNPSYGYTTKLPGT